MVTSYEYYIPKQGVALVVSQLCAILDVPVDVEALCLLGHVSPSFAGALIVVRVAPGSRQWNAGFDVLGGVVFQQVVFCLLV